MATMTFRDRFLGSLLVLLDLHQVDMSGEAQAAFFQTVEKQPEAEVLAVLEEFRTAERMPKPWDVLQRIKQRRPVQYLQAPKMLPPTPAETAEIRAIIEAILDPSRRSASSRATPSRSRC